MRRIMLTCLVSIGCGLTLVRSAPAPEEPPKPPPLVERLAQPIGMPPLVPDIFGDKQTKISEALEHMSKACKFSLTYNDRAFQTVDANYSFDNYFGVPLLDKGPFPVMTSNSIANVLRRIVSRVPTADADSNHQATFIVRGNEVEVTTLAAVRAEFCGHEYDDLPLPPLVTVDFQERTLKEALKELASQSGANVVLDARVAEKAKTPVTAKLANTPFDAAVRVLADMAGLKQAQIGNVIYVTTPENAALIAAENEQKLEKKHRRQAAPEGSGSAPGSPAAPGEKKEGSGSAP